MIVAGSIGFVPTIPDVPGPYRFFFYSFDCGERPHVHVQRESLAGKFRLRPLELARAGGCSARELRAYYSILQRFRRPGMSTAEHEYPRIVTVEVTDRWISAGFSDGRRVSLPLDWSWRLERATPAQRARWELIGGGEGVRWPDIDEDLSARGFFVGTPAPRPRARSS